MLIVLLTPAVNSSRIRYLLADPLDAEQCDLGLFCKILAKYLLEGIRDIIMCLNLDKSRVCANES